MKKTILILVTVSAVVAAFFLGHLQGRSSGFEDGVVWRARGDDLARGMHTISILRVLEQTNYTRLAESLNDDIDAAICQALLAEKHLVGVRLPHEYRQLEKPIQEAFGTHNGSRFRALADFRRKHPSPSKDKMLLEAVNELLEKY